MKTTQQISNVPALTVRIPKKIEILGLLSSELERILSDWGYELYRGRQILGWVYQRGASSFNEMTNLSHSLRAELSRRFTLNSMTAETVVKGDEGTKKFIFRLSDGFVIESVLMKDTRGRGWTACVSTQVGCPVGCKFCLTGKAGFYRNLRSAEIMGQIVSINRTLPPGKRITHIVLMGMGEPLLNYEEVLRAIRIMISKDGLQLSPKRVTLSTVGIPPAMQRLGRDAGVSLALSLSAATDKVRSSLIPLNRRYPIKSILKACRQYPHKKIMTFEYVLLRDVNDSILDARRLTRLLKGIWCKVNLIPYNPISGGGFETPSAERVRAFQKALLDAHITATVRKSKGSEVQAACGQLGGPLLEGTKWQESSVPSGRSN